MGNPIDKYRQNAVLEGGSSGSSGGGSGMASKAPHVAAAISGLAASSMPFIAATKAEEAMKERREAANEMKREKRGVEKNSTDRARDDAAEMKMLLQTEKAYNASKSSPDNLAKGGMTASARADGCCTKGKTRGKMY